MDAPRIACTFGFYTSLLRSQSRSRINPERIFPYRTTKDTNSFNSTRRSNRSIDLYSTKLRRKDRRKFDITSKANLNYTFLDYTKKVARNRIIVNKFSQRMYESSHRLIIDCHSKIKIAIYSFTDPQLREDRSFEKKQKKKIERQYLRKRNKHRRNINPWTPERNTRSCSVARSCETRANP